MVKLSLVLILGAVLTLPTRLFANPVELPVFDDEVKRELTELKRSSQQQVDFVLKSGDMEWAKDLERQSQQVVASSVDPSQKAPLHPLGEGMRKLIFVSWSMGENEIKSLLRQYDGQSNVGLLFRGIPDGMKMIDALAKLQKLSLNTKSSASVLLDPVSFQKYAVSVVPVVVIEEGDDPKAIAKGTSSIETVEEALKDGKSGDLGFLGPSLPIEERDLIELMRERAAELDPEELKRRAIARFWKGQTMFDLPHAEEDRTRRLDPTITVQEDMIAPDGQLIHRAGDRINPLSIRPFTQRMLIIDPSVPEQVALARDQIQAFGNTQAVTLILTSVNVNSGWDDFERIQGAVGAPAYMLKSDVKERFAIEKTPSIVTADNQSFFIKEISVGRGQGNDQASVTVDP